MVEVLQVLLGQEAFQKLVHAPDALPEIGDLQVAFGAAQESNGLIPVVFSFTVILPDGSRRRAQAVSTAKNVQTMAAALEGWVLREQLRTGAGSS